MICPICSESDVRRIEDGYECENCGYSETPIGWNHPESIRWYKERLERSEKES